MFPRLMAMRSCHISKHPMRKILQTKSLNMSAYKNPREHRFSMTKIVGTVGPVSENYPVLQSLVDEGLRIMRINFSHATYEEAELRMKNLRACRGVHSHSFAGEQEFNLRAVLLDTQGPEIRMGSLADSENNKKITLTAGDDIVLTTDESFRQTGTKDKIFVSYSKISESVKNGDIVLLDDGLISLRVTEILNNAEVKCQILNTEQVGSRKGVNLPGLVVDLPALTDKDRENIEFGIKNDIDFIAASFIRKPEDVIQIREFVEEKMEKYWPAAHPAPKIISKIENMEGIVNFDRILEESDGIMVARGDLGVEIPLQQVFKYQKQMVAKSNAIGKPVIVATQMLESMIKNPRPTRAEISDIGNAVLDGADCVMLSGEVAQGKYPVEAVKMMLSVVKEADTLLDDDLYNSRILTSASSVVAPSEERNGEEIEAADVNAVAAAAVKAAADAEAKLIIVLTDTGYAARMVAKFRPKIPIMCYATSEKVGRQLQVHRGLFPIIYNPLIQRADGEKISARPSTADAVRNAKELGWISKGDKVVLVSADALGEDLGTQVLLRLAQVK